MKGVAHDMSFWLSGPAQAVWHWANEGGQEPQILCFPCSADGWTIFVPSLLQCHQVSTWLLNMSIFYQSIVECLLIRSWYHDVTDVYDSKLHKNQFFTYLKTICKQIIWKKHMEKHLQSDGEICVEVCWWYHDVMAIGGGAESRGASGGTPNSGEDVDPKSPAMGCHGSMLT